METKTIKLFDVIQLRKKYPEVGAYIDANVRGNDMGLQYYVNKDYDGCYENWDEENIYKNLDKVLVKLGAFRGEWVLMWFSW